MRRTKLEIIHDVLRAIQEKGGKIKPTHLLYKSNLSHKKMVEYLDELHGKGFIEEHKAKDGKKIVLTDKGFSFLGEFKKIKEFTDSFGL